MATLFSSAALAEWYRLLAGLLDSGRPLPDAVASTPGLASGTRRALADALRSGMTVAQAWETAGKRWPESDRVLIAAAAATGRLPPVLRRMAAQHRAAAEAKRRVFLAAAYPLFVAHVGILLYPVVDLVLGSAGTYVSRVLSILVPLWGVAGAVLWLFHTRPSLRIAVFDVLPGLSRWQRSRDFATVATTLEAFIEAGAGIGEAWRAAGAAAQRPRLKAAAVALAEEADAGRPPGESIEGTGQFPAAWAHPYMTGEATGQLDSELRHIAAREDEEAARGLRFATLLYPGLLYGAVVVLVAVRIITFYAGYLSQLSSGFDP